MAETERRPAEAAEILRDIGQSGSRRLAGDDRGDELMRLAAEPLLIRSFLTRQESGSPEPPGPRGGLPAGAAFHLQQSHDRRRRPGGAAMYAHRERKLDPSLAPETFAPSPEDREQAITGFNLALPGKTRLSAIPALAALLGLSLICALLLAVF